MRISYERQGGEIAMQGSELGGLVLDAYDLALEADPRMQNVVLAPHTTPHCNALGRMQTSKQQLLRHEYNVMVRVGETEEVIHYYQTHSTTAALVQTAVRTL